jgi:hypothetical protein
MNRNSILYSRVYTGAGEQLMGKIIKFMFSFQEALYLQPATETNRNLLLPSEYLNKIFSATMVPQ